MSDPSYYCHRVISFLFFRGRQQHGGRRTPHTHRRSQRFQHPGSSRGLFVVQISRRPGVGFVVITFLVGLSSRSAVVSGFLSPVVSWSPVDAVWRLIADRPLRSLHTPLNDAAKCAVPQEGRRRRRRRPGRRSALRAPQYHNCGPRSSRAILVVVLVIVVFFLEQRGGGSKPDASAQPPRVAPHGARTRRRCPRHVVDLSSWRRRAAVDARAEKRRCQPAFPRSAVDVATSTCTARNRTNLVVLIVLIVVAGPRRQPGPR